MNEIDNLIEELIKVSNQEIKIPEKYEEKRKLLRGLMNITPPEKLSDKYYEIEKELLQSEIHTKHITRSDDIDEKIDEKIYLWKGDITTLEVDAIVNAANSQMLGCFIPYHNCIDNAIHSASGMALRNECDKIMKEQGHEEETGKAKLTSAYNLPSKYVIHTVGPIVERELTKRHEELLKSCYRACLDIVKENDDIRSIAFCSISTGVFRFPIVRASEIALDTIKEYLRENGDIVDKVIINVFSEGDYDVYKRTAGKNK